jgi:saccharopine dehydrogenase (NAD+, L-lysine-forming)
MQKSGILIIGAGGVGRVVAHKCAQNIDTFKKITLASKTIQKCQTIQQEIKDRLSLKINIVTIDANNQEELIALINKINPKIVLNIALPYQDLTIMQACIKTQTHYLDTANYEHPDEAKFEYKEQWALDKKFKQSNITALLGSGFDPGVTNVFIAYAKQYLFDQINYIDIMDCNDGDHGYEFATNFNPEINIREITANGRYWQKDENNNGTWIQTPPLSVKLEHTYPEIGIRDSYLLYHEELESLVKNIKGLKRIRFFMTFSQKYLKYLEVLQNIGITNIKPIKHNGVDIIPIEFLKTLLPDPASLGKTTKGKTNIGCIIEGNKDSHSKKIYIYNICDHEDAYKEVLSQCVSYTTGVPAMIGAKMIYKNIWNKKGVYNLEEFDAKPFMDELNKSGLPWKILEL